MLDDGTKYTLRRAPTAISWPPCRSRRTGCTTSSRLEGGEDVRLTDDYFIEAQKDRAPEIKITRPGRDFKASPIEEVTVAGGGEGRFRPEGSQPALLGERRAGEGGADAAARQGRPRAQRRSALEDFKLVPGDVVSLYATAKDARKTESTDMFFIEAQPFETQLHAVAAGGGGGGGGGEGEEQNEISQRQKEIIAATWNQIKAAGRQGRRTPRTRRSWRACSRNCATRRSRWPTA